METPPLHAMVLPVPAQGHINPMLHLSALLSSRGCIITFVTTHRSQNMNMLDKSHVAVDLPNIQFVSIPDGVSLDTKCSPDISIDTIFVMLDGLEKQQGQIEQLILRSRLEPATVPITCLISDSFFPWTQDVANKLGIASVMFWAANVTLLCAYQLNFTIEGPNSQESDPEATDLPLEKDELLSMVGVLTPKFIEFIIRRFQGIRDSACVLVNTLEDLERPFLRAVSKSKGHIRCIGPILPPDSDGQNKLLKPATKESVQLEEEVKCLQWLDNQSASSVLYIAFGSVVSFPRSQIEQLALGIEACKQPFLWAARSDQPSAAAGGNMFPEGFVDRTKEQGLIVSWAPQLRVLGHPAIACFLTHCGWNSTLESIFRGVPMLCLPRFADQPLNEKLIVKVMKVGMSLKRGEEGEAGWEEVSRAVMGLMHVEEGKNVKEEARRWGAAARDSVKEGGASHTQLTQFVEDMVRMRKNGLLSSSSHEEFLIDRSIKR